MLLFIAVTFDVISQTVLPFKYFSTFFTCIILSSRMHFYVHSQARAGIMPLSTYIAFVRLFVQVNLHVVLHAA